MARRRARVSARELHALWCHEALPRDDLLLSPCDTHHNEAARQYAHYVATIKNWISIPASVSTEELDRLLQQEFAVHQLALRSSIAAVMREHEAERRWPPALPLLL